MEVALTQNRTGSGARARLPPLSRENSSEQVEQKYRHSPVQNPFKTGPSFSIKGVKHVLPAPQTLKPYVDTRSGTLDTWPAHATGSTSTRQVGLSKNKDLVLIDEEKLGKPQITPKPKFLDNLESFLKKELKSLGVTAVEPNELRLQAHREVFEYLMEDFPTYKPLLNQIKHEYERMISHNRDYIRHLEPLKQVLVTTTEQCEQRIQRLKEMDKPALVKLNRENEKLAEIISNIQTDQLELKQEVLRLQGELSEQYEKYRDEADARKLLVMDINDLRYRQEDLLMQQQSASAYDKGEDPMHMKIALKRLKKDEERAAKNLAEMIAKHADEVPRRDLKILQEKHVQLKAKYEKKAHNTAVLCEEYKTLLAVHKEVLQQKDHFFQESERLRQSATPRPEWEKCADFIPGGIQRWLEISTGKSSDELVDALLTELGNAAGGEYGTPEYFEGQSLFMSRLTWSQAKALTAELETYKYLAATCKSGQRGEAEDVPPYLRYEGQVRNRHFGKRETALLIKDIWTAKAAAEAEAGSNDGGRLPMSSFIVKYLEARFPLQQMVVEWAYNIHDSCQRFAHDERISLFLGILTDEIDEAVYFEQLKLISQILGHFNKINEGEEKPGILTKDMFKLAITDFFEESDKSDAEIDALVKAAEQELDATDLNMIEYTNLFLEDDEGKFGPFVDELKKQQEKEKVDYVADIMKELEPGSKVMVDDLMRAITTVDPEIDNEQLYPTLFWAYRCETREELNDANLLPLDELEQRLINGAIKRVGPK